MTAAKFWLLLVGVAMATGGVAATVRTRLATPAEPRVDYPEYLELGEHEQGDHATARFTVANPGGRELLIDDIRPSCSCAGLERTEDGRDVRFESLRVPPGGRVELSLRVTARGLRTGDTVYTDVAFRTNAPDHPEGRIRAGARLVSGGVAVVPDKMVVGGLLVGKSARQVVEVRDRTVPPRRVERVVVARPDHVRVTDVTLDLPAEAATPDGVTVARFTVEVRGNEPAQVDDVVQVYVAGRPTRPDEFRVIGRVVPPVAVTPATVVLPRRSADGPVYDATCLCRSADGLPFQLAVVHAPDGVRVEVGAEGPDTPTWVVRVVCDPATKRPTGGKPVIRLRATLNGGDHDFSIPLHLEQ